ncbi:MAG: hypothetical protein ACXACH_03670 [Candidatus Hermodarchaeia archaeon]|jgi:hypothetical protein
MEYDEFEMVQSLIVGASSMLPELSQGQIAHSVLMLLSQCPDFETLERKVLQYKQDYPDDDPSPIIAFGVLRASMLLFAGVLAEFGMESGQDFGPMLGVLFSTEDQVLKKFFDTFDYDLPQYIVDRIGEIFM